MDQLTRIHIQGFRRLRDVDLPLKPLNVLIGGNGCGKTSLLDVFSLLSASADGRLDRAVHDIGGVDANLSTGGDSDHAKASEIRFELEKQFTDFPPLQYGMSLKPAGVAYVIWDESLTQQLDPLETAPLKLIELSNGDVEYYDSLLRKLVFTEELVPDESTLYQVGVKGSVHRHAYDLRRQLASVTRYHVLDVSSRAPIRLPQQLGNARLPGPNGEELAACLYTIREEEPDRFEIIEDTLHVAFPGFDRLNFPPVASGMLSMTWKDKEFTQPFYPHQLSEGTLRFLWLVTLLYSPGLTEITLIDEPEVSLHPELLSVLADCLREASKRTQLIVATHADRLIRFLRPDEVVAMDIEDGYTTATRASELDLDNWLKEYSLDQLWEHGHVGGRS